MSNLDTRPAATVCGGREDVSAQPVHELLTGRMVQLGESTEVRRLLPNLGRRMVGAWCFVDHYGPDDIGDAAGMDVPPHPHLGLQTVSWLHDGEILHRDSIGSVQTLKPYQLGLMTAGRAIAHAEVSPREHPRILHGAQLWVALPDAHRWTAPMFEHHPTLPVVDAPGLHATVILGELDGAASPGTTFSPLMGADLALDADAQVRLPLEPDFEYAVLAMSGEAEVDGVPVAAGSMLYLGCGRRELPLRANNAPSGLMLLGGEPFEEKILMWWNFVARTSDEITEAREAWNAAGPNATNSANSADSADSTSNVNAASAGVGAAHADADADTNAVGIGRFGEVHGYDGDRLLAPALPATPLKPRGRVR